MLKIQSNLTGTFARNTSLRAENAAPSYIKGSNDKKKIEEEKQRLINYFIQSMIMYKNQTRKRDREMKPFQLHYLNTWDVLPGEYTVNKYQKKICVCI